MLIYQRAAAGGHQQTAPAATTGDAMDPAPIEADELDAGAAGCCLEHGKTTMGDGLLWFKTMKNDGLTMKNDGLFNHEK